MKVVVIPSWYPPNGGGFFANQTKWLREAGVEATVISLHDKGIKNFRLSDTFNLGKTVKTNYLGIPTLRKVFYRIPFLIRVNNLRWIRHTIRLTENYIDKYGLPDVIQVHSCMWAGLVAARLKEKYGIPYVITEHRGRFNKYSASFKGAFENWHYPLLKVALENADALILVSKNLVPTLEEIAQKKLNCTCIPNPVDASIFHPEKTDKKDDAIHFINISAFTGWKALDVLLLAFAEAVREVENLHLNLVGNGPEYQKIRSLCKKLQLEKQVSFLGMLPAEQVHEKLVEADFMVLSSRTESQGVVVSEALLTGIPVIATQVISDDDVPEFAGKLVQKENVEELAKAMIEASRNKLRYDVAQIRNFAVARFSKEAVIQQLIEVLESVIRTNTKAEQT